jgi:hypothetical protein
VNPVSQTGAVAAAWLYSAAGLILAVIGGFFILIRPALLAEDLRFLAARSTNDVDQALPRLRTWLRRVFIVLGGHALAAGTLTIFVAATAVRDGDPAATAVLTAAGAASIGVMVVVNFAIRSAYRWLLLTFAAIWPAATVAALWP